MADDPEFMTALKEKVQEVIRPAFRDQDWTEEDKKRLWEEYMTELDGVLRDMMPKMIEMYSGKKPTVAEDTDDDLEDAKIRHEATLLAVTKQRKEYPAYLSNLLGKTTRYKKNAAEVVKVELPLREPLESGTVASEHQAHIDALVMEADSNLSDIVQNTFMEKDRLANLNNFAKMVVKGQDPTEALIRDIGD